MKNHLMNVVRPLLVVLIAAILIFPHVSAMVSHAASAQDQAELVNLAEGIDAQVSSAWDDPEGFWRSEFLTDGSVLMPWPIPEGETLGWRSGAYATRDAEVTVDLDLGKLAMVSRIELYPRGSGRQFPTDYSVSISTDEKTWTEISAVTDDTEIKSEARVFSFEATPARYVNLTITKMPDELDGGSYDCTLSEIMVFGTIEAVQIEPTETPAPTAAEETSTITETPETTASQTPAAAETPVLTTSQPSESDIGQKRRTGNVLPLIIVLIAALVIVAIVAAAVIIKKTAKKKQ